MTEGFHPKPKMSFPSALALGTESLDEVIELELTDWIPESELKQRLIDDEQPGLGILDVATVPDGLGKAKLRSTSYNLPILDTPVADLQQRIDTLLGTETIEVERKDKLKTFNVATEIKRLYIDDERLEIQLAAGQQASLKAMDVVELLSIQHLIEGGQYLTRTKVELENEIDSTLRVTEKQTS